jgi:8-oxo-dGTP diphosphatase
MRQILVTAAVINEADKFLMARRSHGDEAGKWEFPGGKVEPGEDPRDCLRRELREELGVQAEVGQVLEVVSTPQNDRHLVLLYFKCVIVEGKPEPLQCREIKWINRKEIGLLDKPPADRLFWESLPKSD